MSIVITPSPFVTSAGTWQWCGMTIPVYGYALPVCRFGVWYGGWR